MGERRSSRPKKEVAYTSFAGEDSPDDEDDFVVAKPALKSDGKSNSTKENKHVKESKPSRDKQQQREQNNKAKDKIDARKEETKKRIPLDEKLLMRDIQKAVKISMSQSSQEEEATLTNKADDNGSTSTTTTIPQELPAHPQQQPKTTTATVLKPITTETSTNGPLESKVNGVAKLIAVSLTTNANTATTTTATTTNTVDTTATTTTNTVDTTATTTTYTVDTTAATTTTKNTAPATARNVPEKLLPEKKSKTSRKRSHESDDDDDAEDEEDGYSSENSDDDDDYDGDEYSTKKSKPQKKVQNKVKVQKVGSTVDSSKVTKSRKSEPVLGKAKPSAPPLTGALPPPSSSSTASPSSSSIMPASKSSSKTPTPLNTKLLSTSIPRSPALRLGLSRKSRVAPLHPMNAPR